MPVTCYLTSDGAVAQLGERLLCKQEAVGSIPSSSTNDSRIDRPEDQTPLGEVFAGHGVTVRDSAGSLRFKAPIACYLSIADDRVQQWRLKWKASRQR